MGLLSRKEAHDTAEATPAENPNYTLALLQAAVRLVGVVSFGVTTIGTALALSGMSPALAIGLGLVAGGSVAYLAMILTAVAILRVVS